MDVRGRQAHRAMPGRPGGWLRLVRFVCVSVSRRVKGGGGRGIAGTAPGVLTDLLREARYKEDCLFK